MVKDKEKILIMIIAKDAVCALRRVHSAQSVWNNFREKNSNENQRLAVSLRPFQMLNVQQHASALKGLSSLRYTNFDSNLKI